MQLLQVQSLPQRIVDVNGYSVRYLDVLSSESDRVVVLLHGIGASADRWNLVIPTLARYFRVVAPDIIGFGYSDKPTVEYTMDFFLDFLATFLKNLGILKPVIVASSFGGHLATEYAVGHSRQIEKLVLVSPAGMMRTSTPVLDSYIMSALYPTYENSEKAFSAMSYDPAVVSDDVINDFVNRMKLPNSKYAFMSTLLGMRFAPRLRGRLGKITCPTLLLWGDSDKMIPVQYAKEYREIPDLELVVIKNCGHVSFIEKPMTFNKLVLRFLLGNQMSL